VEIVGLVIGTVLTLAIFSYLLGDNVLYRWALALLVGAGVGYALGIALRFLVFDWIAEALNANDPAVSLTYAVPLLLGGLLLFKGFGRSNIAVLGNIPLAFLVGVGAAAAVSGALTGTLIPQVRATGMALNLQSPLLRLVEGAIVLVGTIAALAFFSPTGRTAQPGGLIGGIQGGIQHLGKIFVVIALGVAFSGAVTSALTAWVMRLWQIVELADRLFFLFGG
jgi:hypothetical protein